MKILFVLVAVVLAIVVFRNLRSSAKPAGKSSPARKRVKAARAVSSEADSSSTYHAVSVKSGPGACEQALAMDKKRFLPAEVSQLPLADCTSSDCQCKFVHYPDRRDADNDKRAPTALRSELYTRSGKPERRTQSGRRKTDTG
jgi:hypothetical protein